MWQLKPTPESLNRCSVQVKFVAVFQTIIRGIKFPQIRARKTNSNSPAVINTFQQWWKYEWKSFYINQYVCQFAYNKPMAFWKENSKSLKLGMHVCRTWMESRKCASKAWTWGATSSAYVGLVSIHGQFRETQLSWGSFHQLLLILKRRTLPQDARVEFGAAKRKLNCPMSWINKRHFELVMLNHIRH